MPSLHQIAADYQTLQQGAGTVDLGSRTQIELRGEDRCNFLNGFCTNNIQQLQPGTGCEAFLTNLPGKILGHVFVYCYPTSLVLETTAGQAERLTSHLDRYIIQEDVTLHDQTDSWHQTLAAGQQATSLLSKELGTGLPGKDLEHVDTEYQSIPLSIRNVPWSRHCCYAINYQQAHAATLEKLLTRAGMQPCSHEAADICRIEAGFPHYQQDITENNLPQEIDRNDRAISFTKGCYLGQETVARIDALGHVNRKLRGLRFSSSAIPAAGTELHADGKTVAQVTSSCYSPACESPLALGFVHRGHDQSGQTLTGPAGTATVCSLPFDNL